MVGDFINDINDIIGMKCWDIVAGEMTGSMLTLNFGHKIPIIVSWLKAGIRRYSLQFHGENELYVECCSWRVISNNAIITSNYDPLEKMLAGLNPLLNCTVTAVKIDDQFLDCEIELDKIHKFQIFSNQTVEDMGNYTFFCTNHYYVIDSGSHITREERRPRKPFYLFGTLIGWH